MADLGGLSPHHAAAGVGGALASLPFIRPGSKLAAVGTVVAGLATATFMTPIVAEILATSRFIGSPLTKNAEYGVAFLLGLTAMLLIPALLGGVGWIKDNIARVMERVTGVAPKDGGGNGTS